MYKKGLDKDVSRMTEKEQMELATRLSLQKSGFDFENNRFTRELELGCENVEGDGFCLFRAIARQIEVRNLNARRRALLLPLPTTMEGVLESVTVYFSQHSREIMDRIFPSPRRENFGRGDSSEASYQAALKAYRDEGERKRRLEEFRSNFYEYINLGKYNAGGALLNAADWLPQIMSDVLGIDIDIYDGQRPGGGFHTNNRHTERIGLGRINNNHYISLNGNLELAWKAEQAEIRQAEVNVARQRLGPLQGKSIAINPLVLQYYRQQKVESQFLLKPEFGLRQLVQAEKIWDYLSDQIKDGR